MIRYIKQSVILVTIAFIDISFPNRFDHGSRQFNYPAKTKILHIGGIFPMAGSWAGGRGCRPAVDIALEDVNNRSDILPGFKLKMLSNDSRCMPGLGMNVLYELLYNDPVKLMLLGPGCSVVSTFVGQAARMWNLVVLSYGSSSPALSSRKRFPTFFRTHPSATLHNPTRIKLFKKFGWTRIATIQETQEVFTSTMEDLEERAKSNGIEIAVRTNFLVDPANAVRNLKRQDARVIVGLFYEDKARRVFCEVYKQKLYGPKYVWFIIGWYADNWFMEPDTNCTVDQMKEALEGHFTTEGLMLNSDNNVTVSGMTAKEFIEQLNKRIKRSVGSGVNPLSVTGYVEAPLAYDAVWALALALNKTQTRLQKRNLSLEQFSYSNKEIMEEIYCAMNSTDFLGVSGHVAFNSEGDRIALTQIEQMIDGNYTIIGFYDIASDELKWFEKEIWKDGKKPQDRTIIKHYVRVISSVLFVTICLLASVGIICSLLLLFFNTIHRNKRVIRMSQPHINNIMLIGCIVCFGCIFVNGLDATYVNNDILAQICQVRTWMLCIGFTLAYGALFSKVWTIYRLTTRRKVEIKAIKEWEMYIVIVVCLLLDFILMMAWQLIDPMHVHLENFPSERPEATDQDIEILPQLQHCISDHLNIWFGIAFGYKGILLLFGILLAYETRNIKVKQVNDSRFVGMSIYNVVVLCVITVPVTLIISSHQDATFAFVSVAILLSNFLSMGLIFIPKILDVSQMTDDNSSITDTITCNMEDEHHRRLLQENEELKAQIIEKEERIQELKRQLQMKCETNQKRFVSFKDDVVDSRCLLSDDQTNKIKQERSLLPSLCSVDEDDCSKLHSTSKTDETDLEFSDSSDNIFYKSYASSQSFPRKSDSNKLRTSAITMLTKLSEVTAEERCSESYC